MKKKKIQSHSRPFPSWKPFSDEASTAYAVCTEDDCQVLNRAPRVCKSLSADSQGLLIKLHNDIQLERDMFRGPGWASVGGKKHRTYCTSESTSTLNVIWQFHCFIITLPRSPFGSWLPDMHNAKDMAIFADNKELQQLNHRTHYIHKVINYLQYGLPHILIHKHDVYTSGLKLAVQFFYKSASFSNPSRKPITLSVNNSYASPP